MDLFAFPESPFQLQLSFEPLMRRMQEAAGEDTADQGGASRELLEEAALHPELIHGITDESQIHTNTALIRRLFASYFPEALSANEIKGISLPYTNMVFNLTERFRKILEGAGEDFEYNIRNLDLHQFYVLNCCLILNKYYNTQLDFRQPLFYDIPAPNGVMRHYRILYNADYLEIIPTEQSQQLSSEDIAILLDNYHRLDLWKKKFPPGSWLMRGFALMSLVDVTTENAVSLLKEKLIRFRAESFEKNAEPILQSIFNTPHIRMGFSLYDEERDMLKTAAFGSPSKSYLVAGDEPVPAKGVFCSESYEAVIRRKRYFTVSNVHQYRSSFPWSGPSSRFASEGVSCFILAPVVSGERVLGVLEILSALPGDLNSINANKLDVVMPHITNNIKRLIAEYQNQVQVAIQDKYTSIHSSVYWKFKQEAERYLRSRRAGEDALPAEIVFNDVMPYYAAIDVRGSSLARNRSIQKDLQRQLNTALGLLEQGGEELDATAEIKTQLVLFLKELDLPLRAGTEQAVTDFMRHHFYPLACAMRPSLANAIDQYLEATEPCYGLFHEHRRKYEETISLINDRLSALLDERQKEAQRIFPHYYERFKSDGIEHNLYVGPSISPESLFTIDVLKSLRLWQLRVLCEMERTHHEMKDSLPYPLDVTTLVLVHQSPISIRFRMDEKRFDVDGSYNARFEIVKKRIDKAHILGTAQRITEPGKLAIVYTTEDEEQEYSAYLRDLSVLGLLEADTEKHQVEDLQGVAGLKVLRARIKYE